MSYVFHHVSRPRTRAPRVAATALLPILGSLCAVAPRAHAGPTWDGTGVDERWSTAANWAGDALPPNDGSADLVFDGILHTSPDMDANWAARSLTFATGANGFTLGSAGNFTLTIGAGGIVNNSTRTQVIDTSVALSAPQTWHALARIALDRNVNLGAHALTIDGVQTVYVGGAVGGTGAIRKNGSGTLVLDGTATNTFGGGIHVNAGTLLLTKSGGGRAMTAGALTIGDGAGGTDADVAVLGAPDQLSSAVALHVNSSGLLVGNGHLTATGALTMTGGRIQSPYLRVIGNLATNASTTSATIGAGTIDLFSGTRTWTVADGAAAIDLDVAAAPVNGELVKTGPGALRLTSAGTFDGGLTLNAGTLLVAHDSALGAATITFAGGTLRGDGGPRTLANAVHLTGPATVDGSGSLTLRGPISGAAPLTKNGPGTLTIGGASSNANAGGVTVSAGTLVFAKTSPAVATGIGAVVVGDGAGTDALVLGASNQFPVGATLDVRGSGVVYGNAFFNVITNLTLTGGRIEQGNLRTTGNVVVNASAVAAQISGGTLDFSGSVRTFNVADGAAPIDLDVGALVRSNGGINKTGAGTMRMANVNQGTLGTTLSSGTLIFAHPASAGAATLAIGAAGNAVVESGLPAALRVVGAPSIASPGKLDVTDNDLVIDYTVASPQGAVRAMLQTGAIVTSSGTPGGLSIGYAEATDLFTSFPANFAGQSVDDTTLLMRFTRIGDANLDGTVSLPDFNRLAANFGTGDAWFEGDFNYDGAVTLQDFNLLAANFGLAASRTIPAPGDWAALASAVPEPGAAFGMFCVGALVLPRRAGFRSRTANKTA